jgi:hypothetical protein
MDGGIRLAIAIAVIFLAMVAFFFAFHPGGVQGISDPDTMLQWLMGEFENTANPGSANSGQPGADEGTPSSNPISTTTRKTVTGETLCLASAGQFKVRVYRSLIILK